MACSETPYERNIMNENKKISKMDIVDKIVAASTVAMYVGVGISCGIYLHKTHLLNIKAVTEHNDLLAGALDQTIDLVADSLKQ